jgi:signal transduction histidine kinase
MASLRPGANLAHLALYLLAVDLGRLAGSHADGVFFFWPAAGIAALWLMDVRGRWQVLFASALLVAGTTVLDIALGVAPLASVVYGVANLTVGLTVRAFSARAEGSSYWDRPPRRLARPRDLIDIGIASAAASLASAVPGMLAVLIDTGDVSGAGLVAWVVRNTSSTFIVVTSVLGVLTTVFRSHARNGWAAVLTPKLRPHWRPELLTVSVLSLGAALLLFSNEDALPIAYAMIVASIWLGYRFSPVVGGVYTSVFAIIATLYTQAGVGPFGQIEDLTARAVTVQVYALVTAVVVMLLSTGASERAALYARVTASEARATSRVELLDAVMNAITDGLVVLEGSGEVMMRNPAAERMMGPRRPPGQDGPDDYGIFRPDGSSIAPDELPHLHALAGVAVPAEDLVRIDPRTGLESTLSIGALPLVHAADDGSHMAVVVIHDVTAERSHRRELQAFAGTVAHDLKTPLTGIGSWAEILGDQLDELEVDVTEPRSSLRRIETSAARMQQLIADLLAYSQAQNATLSPLSLSLTGLVEQVAREQREIYARLRPVIEHGPLGRVVADRTLVGQLLSNVIGNALKYVEPGTTPHVVISSEQVGDLVEVRVADNGIGIPRSERGRIFDSFYRASSSGGYPGTGLGLAICARAVERHGGRISAQEGLDGRGTTLVFTLPADLEAEVEPDLDDDGGGATWDQRVGETTRAEPPPRRTGSETAVR